MRTITTSIDIDAPAATVWAVLTDLASYHEWNPLVVSAEGEAAPDARLRVAIALPGRKPMTFSPQIVTCESESELHWLGRLILPGIFDGRHQFSLRPAGPTRTRFEHSETFSGILVPVMWGGLEDPTRRGFAAMNEALKRRAEARYRAANGQPSVSPAAIS